MLHPYQEDILLQSEHISSSSLNVLNQGSSMPIPSEGDISPISDNKWHFRGVDTNIDPMFMTPSTNKYCEY